MKATGIVRRIDELGRIVIPKEIRRTFKIKEGTPLEIFCGENNELILKKYSTLFEIKDFADEICLATYQTLNTPVFVCDKEKIVAISGMNKSYILNKNISTKLEKIIDNRKDVLVNKLDGESVFELFDGEQIEYFSQVIVPVIAGGDTFGAIVCFSREPKKMGLNEKSVLKCMANFLAEQIIW